uniref:Uncharacterized protein n=1 Tax=Moniliophthora roreri TaxID=221103 RepID=A0A0W0FE96_MONRR
MTTRSNPPLLTSWTHWTSLS